MGMTKEEFLLRAVKDGSLSIDEALKQLNVKSSIPDREQLKNDIIDKVLHGGCEEGEYFKGMPWTEINEFLRKRNWIYKDSSNVAESSLLNARELCNEVLNKLFKRIDDGNKVELFENISSGVFTAQASLSDGFIGLDLTFTPESTCAGCTLEEFNKYA